METPEPPIFRLPTEIVLDIFHLVANKGMSIRNVRLTCRYWRDLIASDRLLPRKIVLRPDCDFEPHLYFKRDHCVHSARQLANALECIGDACFYFHINVWKSMSHENWDIIPWHRFAVQCVELYLNGVSRDFYPTLATILTRLPPLRSLRHLSSNGDCLILPCSLPTDTRPILLPLLRLRSLMWRPKGNLAFTMEPIRYLFINITRLGLLYLDFNISTAFLIELFSSCTKLTSLRWIAPRRHSKKLEAIKNGVNWQFELRELEITYGLLPAFPPDVLSGLASLTERLHPSKGQMPISEVTGTKEDRLYFPRLRELTVASTQSDLLHIKAPNLHRLCLSGDFGAPEYVSQMELTPRIMEIEDWENGAAIEAFLARTPIPNLVELQMHVGTWAYGGSDGRLARLLSADIGKQSSILFPDLKFLLVKLHKWHSMAVTMEEKQGISDALGGLPYPVIVDGRNIYTYR
ncbi:hypothetical protein FRC15_002865 [Serendipita sp. 397]|nr:hypothetical protein FRC15_002865 [Serendipita sp. 397]